MNRINIAPTALLALAATALWGQDSGLSVRQSSWKGIEVGFVTKVEPPGENGNSRLPGGVSSNAGRAQHIIQDREHKRYFGYDVQLEPSEDGSTAQVRIEPLSPSSFTAATAGLGWTLLALPQYPVIPGVKVGDTVELDLLVNAATGQKIVDYLTLWRRQGGALGRLRDFSLADVELSLIRPRVQVNGKLVEAMANFQGGTSGAVVWLYLAGHGRFVLSLFPNEKLGFQKNGVAAADTLSFRDGSTEYRVECGAPVAPGSGPYNLYVLHEAWHSRGAEPFIVGSADKAEWVVGAHF
jgi:hypothetical protein